MRQQLLIDCHVQDCRLWKAAIYRIACALNFFAIVILTGWMSAPVSTFTESFSTRLDETIDWAQGD